MKLNNTVVTLALLGVLALAALAGGLIPMGSPVYAANPVFGNDTFRREVPENTPPGVNIGDPISATDTDEDTEEFGDTLTYSLEASTDTDEARADAASFDIDPSTGQLITKAPLDADGTKTSYTVTVRVDDGETRPADSPCTGCTRNVTITVTNDVEPPAAPAAPAVVSGAGDDSTTSLKVVWHEPDSPGGDITNYQVQYKKTTGLTFFALTVTDTTATITGLEADTSYHVRVRSTGDESQSGGNEIAPWSLVGTGWTNKENNIPPTFGTGDAPERNVFENTPAGEGVGAPVTANDSDATILTYTLDGPDVDSFSLDTASGQIRTKSPLNHEDPGCGYVSGDNPITCTYKVTVTVADGAGGSDATAVTIVVGDRHEPVLAPARPTVRPTENWSTRLEVSWNAPANTGPPITGYAVRYRQDSTGTFSNDNCGFANSDGSCDNITGTKTTIFGLTAGKSHQVQVLTIIAGQPERRSVWSDSGTGSTNAANKEPRFDDRPSSGDGSARDSEYTTTRNIDENTRPGQPVGRAVRAEDGDGHSRTYRLAAAGSPNQDHFNMFDIDKSSGQIRTKSPLNHEDSDCGYVAPANPTDPTTCTYTVKVQVWDGYNTHEVKEDSETPVVDDTITVTINVRDKDETPEVPAVTVTSPMGNTTLAVIWDAPANTGPATITYDVQYRKGSAAYSNDNCGSLAENCDGLTATTATIEGLDADTSYSVQVRARNDEGPSSWSRVETVKTNKGTNAPPDLSSSTAAFSVSENTRSGQFVGTVTATDGDSDRWSYSLRGADAASFNFNTGTGDITTKLGLNFEEKPSYSVRVRASDGTDGGSSSLNVAITVTNKREPPIPPTAPRVTAIQNSGWSLDVTWNEPRNMTGKPPITDYDIQYRRLGDTTWQSWPHGADVAVDDNGDTDRSAKIRTIRSDPGDAGTAAHLEPRTQYEVEVRASNAEGTSDWSPIGRGTTGAGNSRPSFDRTETLVTLKVDENTRSGQNVGSAVSATDADGNRLTYRLEGPGKDSFTIVASSGQISTRSPLDHESRSSYSVTVEVDDNTRRANSGAAKSVTITVDNVDEVPPPPAAPRVAGIPGSTDSINVTWDASANTGPPITDYEVRWGISGSGGWTTLVGRTGADRSQIITGLTAGTRYAVQVRAKSDEGTGDWSRSGTGTPNPDVANRPPAFSGTTRTFNIAENTGPGVDIGVPVAATDRDGDVLTYTLEGTDADSFSILSTGTGGQIQTSAALNHEEKASYSVTVRVSDGRGGTDAVNVTIRVTDVNGEAPDTPLAPAVTAVSSTSLAVTWDAPANAGPPIADYDYRYREQSGPWTEVTGTTITSTTVTIDGLEASTYYDVEVRATNAEGTSDWSNAGTGTTNEPGANNLPVFTDGASATRSVSATAQAGASIGLPVTATDADPGDTLTYSLEGRDATLFDINTSSGQLLTESTLIAGETYTVRVVADDTKDRAIIEVTISATAGPPNNLPVFSDGARATRSVARSAAAGTAIGQPVTATDADAGTTLNYTLEGADEASFGINPANGQLSTIAGVTLDQSTYTVDVVASDGTASSRITVTINVVLNTAPEFASSSTSRSVVENSRAGTNVGAPVTATDADQGDTLTYTLGGADAGSFTIVAGTGQIQTTGVLDEETRSSHTVTVTANDRTTDSVPITVTIAVTDVTFGCASSGAVSDTSNRGLVADCEALREARNKLEDGGARLNWFEGTPIDQWQGIKLSGSTPRVTEVDLKGMGLSGTLPAELGDVPMLTKLNLRGNRLTGSIPGSLNRLSRLETLLLHDNILTGTIPNLSGLRNLEMLWLSGRDMNLTGGVPSWFNSMSSLESVSLWGNSLGGPIPRLTGMTSLNLIKLQSNGFTGTVPAWFADMDSLRTLYLHDNNLNGGIPAAFGRHTRLLRLWLKDNSLTGSIPAELADMTNLRTLNLHTNQLSGAIPAALGDMSNLQQLLLHGNQLSGAIPAALGDMSSLRQLWVSNNMLDGAIPAALGGLSNLQQLNLHTNQLSGDIPSALGRLTNLTRLRIGGREGVPGNTGLTGCVPSALRDATDADDLALAGANGISICP